jgi:hypothetical protein
MRRFIYFLHALVVCVGHTVERSGVLVLFRVMHQLAAARDNDFLGRFSGFRTKFLQLENID